MATQLRTPSATAAAFSLLCGNAFIMYIDRTNMAIAAPVIKGELGLSNTQLGLAFSAFAISYACFMIIGGRLGDRIGPRRGLAICGLIWSISTLATGLATGLATLIAARFVLGMGEAAVYPISARAIAKWIPLARRGSAQGVLHGAGRVGAALCPLAVTTLIVLYSWRAAFYVLGAASLVYVVVLTVMFRDDPREHPRITQAELDRLGDEPARAAQKLDWRRFLARVWPATGVAFCQGWMLWFFLNWVPLFFSHARGLNLKDSALFSTLVLIGGIIGTAGGGLATDWRLKRTGSQLRARRDIVVFGFLSTLVCIVPLLLSDNLFVDTVFLALAFFLIELADAPIWLIGMEVEPEHAATSSGAVNTGLAIAGAVSPIAIGWLLDVTGNWTSAFVLSMVVLLLGPVFAYRVRLDQAAADSHPIIETTRQRALS